MTTMHGVCTAPAGAGAAGPECNKKYAKIQEGIESSISLEGKARITRILCEIKQLSDVEKLLLYLKLPTGIPQDDHLRLTPPSCLHTANRKEQGEAFTWIRSHLEEHGDVCMPKAEVYDEYRQYCDHHELRPLCNADFGKMMKQVFPDINTRRLGQRGQSKYFYGGLRKKTDHAPPTLPELEIHNKNLEMDTSSLDNEIFKAACLLICEWADKLLDSKFSSIQTIAEHLVTNLYVNTKSVAAFTLIAAMQESGSHNLKGSALFTSQPSTVGDRHRETNLLLQQKLQKNKLLQKQKEKLQAMREEVEIQHGAQSQGHTPPTPGRKTPGTPVRKSATPSRMSKTPKLTTPSPSPVPLQSPAKLQSKPEHVTSSSEQQIFSKPTAGIPTMQQTQPIMHQSQPIMHQAQPIMHQMQSTMHQGQTGSRNMQQEVPRIPQPSSQTESTSFEVAQAKKRDTEVAISQAKSRDTESTAAVKKDKTISHKSRNISTNQGSVFTFEDTSSAINEKRGGDFETTGESFIKTDFDVEMGDNSNTSSSMQEQMTMKKSETPYSEMETNQSTGSHVRKINFDDIFEHETSVVKVTSGEVMMVSSESHQHNNGSNKEPISTAILPSAEADGRIAVDKRSDEPDKLSKSDGHISLKALLERKDGDKSSLNKSLGVIEKSKNTLFVNQSNVPGRSAFVPFSQVQNRKENAANQTASSGIPIFIPSSSINQSTSVTMIAVPSAGSTGSGFQEQNANTNQSVPRVPESIIKILPSTAAFQFKQGSSSSIGSSFSRDSVSVSIPQSIVIQSHPSSTISIATESIQNDNSSSDSSSSCFTKDTQTFVTSSTVLSKSSSCDSMVSLSPSTPSSSSMCSKHARTRFTPIRPKASPNKSAPQCKEAKADNPTYDKRPVSEILKEKRAKEQAEALARLQVGMRLPAIPMQPSLAIGRGSIGQLATMPNTVSPKEVVIIVNNQASGASMQTVMAPGMFVAQSLMPSENQNQALENQSVESAKKVKKEGGQSAKSIAQQLSASETITSSMMKSEVTVSARSDSDQDYNTGMMVDKEASQEREDVDTGADVDRESEHLDKVDMMWTETPAKIAKLNITSPYRPDSACSLGRDTPVKIMKTSDSCSSRPESACSFGRETPSGARKRKSSDYNQRRDFKRLNSTGDEGDDAVMKLQSDALSPEIEARFNQNVRRTRSCTYELDKEIRFPSSMQSTVLLTEGLQSPDITSLEREALLESGFHSMLAGNKNLKQTSSVGVSVKSLRHSQQKLMNNKPDLDQRVRNFLQKDENVCLPVKEDKHSHLFVGSGFKLQRPSTSIDSLISVQNVGNGASFKLQRPNTSIDNLITKDAVTELRKAGEMGLHHASYGLLRKFGGINAKPDIEPSGLPSDVADWINETIEKRQQQNTSVLSEPDLGCLSQKPNLAADLSIADFKFEVGNPISSQPSEGQTSVAGISKGGQQVAKSEESMFTVPRAPAIHVRGKDGGSRTAEIHGKSPRCQSLPTFSSPCRLTGEVTGGTIVPPVTSPVSRQGLFRATSMSPRTPQHEIIQESSGITSPIQRIDNHPLSLSVHAGSKFKEDLSGKQHTRQGSFEEGRSSAPNQVGSYLASMQHTLQKPSDNPAELYGQKPREIVTTETQPNMTSPQPYTQVAVSKSPFPVDRNLPQIQERYVSQTPFSDSGYHSNGTSPVHNYTPVSGNYTPVSGNYTPVSGNYTPVSGMMELDIGGHQYQGKRSNHDSVDFMSGVSQQSPLQSPNLNNSMATAIAQTPSTVISSEAALVSSANSAFVPIQGSSQDARYVTPIKPTVTLPNTGDFNTNSSYSTNLFIEPIQTDPQQQQEEAMIISPQNQDPPSYEIAIKSLRKSGNVAASSNDDLTANITTGFQDPALGGHTHGNAFGTVDTVSKLSPGQNLGNLFTDASTKLAQGQAQGTIFVEASSKPVPAEGTMFTDAAKPEMISPKESSSQERVSLLANMGKAVESDGKQGQGVYGPFASKLVQLSRQTQQKPAFQQSQQQLQQQQSQPQQQQIQSQQQPKSVIHHQPHQQSQQQQQQSLLKSQLLQQQPLQSQVPVSIYAKGVPLGNSQDSLHQTLQQQLQQQHQLQQQQQQQQKQLQHRQQSVSTAGKGIKPPPPSPAPSSSLVQQMSQPGVISAGIESGTVLLKTSEQLLSTIDIPASLGTCELSPNSAQVINSLKLPLMYGNQSQTKLSTDDLLSPNGANPSATTTLHHFKNAMDLDFISASQYLPQTSNDHHLSSINADHQHKATLSQQQTFANPSIQSLPQSISNQTLPQHNQSMFTQYSRSTLPSQSDTSNIDHQMMLNFSTDGNGSDQPVLHSDTHLDQFTISDEGIKKDLCVSDSELADISLTLGQYLNDTNEIYDRNLDNVQQLDDFAMFED